MDNNTISYWNMTAQKDKYPRLERDLDTDVLIIGGGITGISCAFNLAKKGIKPVLIETGDLCDGTTGNTTGKVTIQHGIIYSNLIKKYGKQSAALYAASQTQALEFVRDIVKKESIDCQLTGATSYIFAATKRDMEAVENEYEAAASLGIDAEIINNPGFPGDNFGMLGFLNQYAFHPVRYVCALARLASSKDAEIYCNTKAIKVEDGDIKTIRCEGGIIIRAKHLIMATQYPLYDGPNVFYTRLYPKRTYGIAIRAKKEWPDGNYISAGDPSKSIRSHVESGERIMIVVGDSHATGRGIEDMQSHFDNLVNYADHIAGVDKLIAGWSAQDYDTPDQLPYIGRVSDHSNVYVATGFGKWGLSSGTLAGMMLSELVQSGECHYEDLYSRYRSDFLSSPGKAISGALSPIAELIKSKLEGTESIKGLKKGEGRVISYNGKKAGIYLDYEDNVTILDISCTHMSTELNFNNAEKTWDCPAHGGRFNIKGELLEGPPKNPLKVYFEGKYSELNDD